MIDCHANARNDEVYTCLLENIVSVAYFLPEKKKQEKVPNTLFFWTN